MSRTFRFIRKYIKIFFWVIALIGIPFFILWGVGSTFLDMARTGPAGTIFQRKVSRNDFDQAYRRTRMFLYLSGLESYLPLLNPVDFTWDQLILLREAKKRKIRVSDPEVIAYIQKIPAFRDQSGFNPALYQQVLEHQFRTSPPVFEDEVRKTFAAISKLREVVMDEVKLDDEALWKEYRLQHDRRRIAFVELETESFEKDVTLTEEELKRFLEESGPFFERPERIRIQVAGLSFEKETLKEAERRVEEASDALAASDANAEPDAFERIANEKGLTLQTTELFSLFDPPQDLPEEVLVEASGLQPGLASEQPIETASGFYLVKLLEKLPSRTPSFEEARPEIEEALRRLKAADRCQEKAKALLQEIQMKTKETVSFEEAARGLELSVRETPPVQQGEAIKEEGVGPELTRAAFALSLGEVGGVVKTPKGFAILQPKEEVPASREALEAEKETFRERTLQQKRIQHYNEWFRVLKATAQLQSNIETGATGQP